MKRAVLLILGVCFLTSITSQGFSEKPLRLFFEKKIDVGAEAGQEHPVQQGEWLFKILQAKGYTDTQIYGLMPDIRELNPHIPDLNRLRPGQVLRLPGSAPAQAPSPAVRVHPHVPPGTYEKLPYVVRSGDTLVQVLQGQGVPTSLIYGKYLKLFLELNPDIRDVNSLRAGQEVILPVTREAAARQSPSAVAEPGRPASPATAAPATAPSGAPPTGGPGPGAATGGGGSARPSPPAPPSPAANPDAARTPTTAPVEQPAQAATPEAPQARLPETPEAKAAPTETREVRTGLPFIRTVLEQMGFRFVPGDESMFPLPGTGWLHVKMFETPLVDAPWGDKIIFCPVPKGSDWIENANKLGMRVCTVSPQWPLQEVLGKLASAFPGKFRLWGSGRDLVLSRGGIGLTLQSPQMTITEYGGRKVVHMVWARQTPGEPPLPQGLHEVLEPAQVRVIELDAYNELNRLPARPQASIYVPVATHMDLMRALNPSNPEEFFGQTPPQDLPALLQLLRAKDLLQQGLAQASWAGGNLSRIAVQVPAWTVAGGATRIALLDRRFADPYLVSVLSQEGYACFVLPD
jgi:LysM repeat protein